MRHYFQSAWCWARHWPLTATVGLSWSFMMLLELSAADSPGPPLVEMITALLIMPGYLALLASAMVATSFDLALPFALTVIALALPRIRPLSDSSACVAGTELDLTLSGPF